jgi:hypothetical protein
MGDLKKLKIALVEVLEFGQVLGLSRVADYCLGVCRKDLLDVNIVQMRVSLLHDLPNYLEVMIEDGAKSFDGVFRDKLGG